MASQEFQLVAQLTIRSAEAKDATDLHTYCFAEETLEDITNALNEDLKSERKNDVFRLVADASGHAIGNIRLERSKTDDEVGQIDQLAVSAPFRSFRISAKLVEVTEQVAQENDIKTLRIEVPESETSIIQAYKNWGFSERPIVTLEKHVEASEPEAEASDESAAQPEAPAEASGGGGEQKELL
jgi:N-acetylglutamate synthase-like GNAT family acetyltransferase